jgi:hypothetical protein
LWVTAFDYLAVLISIILGLAITQVLKGYRGMSLARERVRIFWPTPVWSVAVLLIAVQSWWAMFGLRAVRAWTFGAFGVVLVQAAVVYMLAALVLPDFFGDEPVDLRVHYFKHRRLFFGALVLLVLVSLTKDLVIGGHLPGLFNVLFQGALAAGALLAMLTERVWFHWILAPAVLIAFLGYIALLFSRLP